MADDAVLANFEIGDALVKPLVKFKGGPWRDRVRAQRSAKRRQNGISSAPPPHAKTSTPSKDATKFEESDRPPKRQRIESGSDRQNGAPRLGSFKGAIERRSAQSPSVHARSSNAAGKGDGKPHGVTSRLFTSNPEPKTAFNGAPVDDTEPPNPSNAPLTDEAENFHALGLSRRLAHHLSTKLEMKAPTSIQKNTIPHLVKDDSDAFLQAETGSGKTLAYLLPIVHRIMALSQNMDGTTKDVKVHRNSGLFAIIMAPTRELCKQIATVLDKLLRCAPWIVSTTVIGGESKKSEKARIRKGVNILIATPGRLTDHLDHTKILDVGTARWLVLDEGDRLMELGFEEDIKAIIGKIREEGLKKENKEGLVLEGALPSRRVTVLCSATMKMNVQRLGEVSLKDATHITAERTGGDDANGDVNEALFMAPAQLKQSYIIAPAKLRLVTLIALLKSTFARKGSVMKAIIFISCADSVDFHFEMLKSAPEPPDEHPESPLEKPLPVLTASTVAPAAYLTSPANPKIVLHKLHGSLAQPVRTSTLASFTAERDPAVLITTDISSRGLDVPAVDLVVEYDPAFAVDDHVHRIGRTARAGRPGKAVLFLMPGCEEGYVTRLQSTSAIGSQLYDSVLQKGLSSATDLPSQVSVSNDAEGIAAPEPEKKSWKARAESLQLHLEQRLLVSDDTASPSIRRGSSKSKADFKSDKNNLLDLARQAFRSHIRAYATHVREERSFFDITQMHLGHMAKSFGLREPPGGIGGGVQRRTYRPSGAGQKSGGTGRGRGDADSDDEGGRAVTDETTARRAMSAKSKFLLGTAEEFNLG